MSRLGGLSCHRIIKAASTALLLLALLLVTYGSAYAHLGLQSATPAAGSTLSVAPGELRLRFTEDVESSLAIISVVTSAGEVQLGPLFSPADSGSVLVARLAAGVRAGVHTVAWRVVGADGHPVSGQYTFTIADGAAGLVDGSPASRPPGTSIIGPAAPGQDAPPVEHHIALSGTGFGVQSPLYAFVRWLTFAGLLGVIGAVAFRGVLGIASSGSTTLSAAVVHHATIGAAQVGLWSSGVLAIVALLRLLAQSVALHGMAGAANPALIGTLLSRTVWGWGWLLQVAGVTVVAAGFASAARSRKQAISVGHEGRSPVGQVGATHLEYREAASAERSTRSSAVRSTDRTSGIPIDARAAPGAGAGWMLASLGAAVLAFTPALSGHAVAAESYAPLAVLSDGLHVVSAGGWMGGLLLLLAVGVPSALRLGGADGGRAVAALVNAFSTTALGFATLTVLTGVFAAWLHVGSIPALWQSEYGRTLLVKLGIVSVVFGTGAYNWLRVRPALGSEVAAERIRRSGAIELAAGILVLAVTAFLVASAPPADQPPAGDSQAGAPGMSH